MNFNIRFSLNLTAFLPNFSVNPQVNQPKFQTRQDKKSQTFEAGAFLVFNQELYVFDRLSIDVKSVLTFKSGL